MLLNVLRSLPSYRGEGSLRAWVDSITLRVGLSHARRVRARERREQTLAEGLADFQQPLPSEAYFTRRQVQRLLSVLPPEQERAVVLHHVVGLEVSEVAEHQGVPTETARSRLRLGMQKLRSRASVREIGAALALIPAGLVVGGRALASVGYLVARPARPGPARPPHAGSKREAPRVSRLETVASAKSRN